MFSIEFSSSCNFIRGKYIWYIGSFHSSNVVNSKLGSKKNIDWQGNDVSFILLLVYFINVLTARATPFFIECWDISISKKAKENLSFEYRIYHICIPGKVCANNIWIILMDQIVTCCLSLFQSMKMNINILDLTSTIMYPEINVRCFIWYLNLELLHPHWIVNNFLSSFAPKLQ